VDTRPGIKTPVFWLAALATVLTYLLGSDVLGGGKDVQVGALVLNAMAAVGYTTYRTWKKKDGEKKPSWRTSEFWLSAAAALCAVLYASGEFGPGTDAGKILGVVVGILASVGYGVQSAPKKAGEGA
jgi:hypothetical protein